MIAIIQLERSKPSSDRKEKTRSSKVRDHIGAHMKHGNNKLTSFSLLTKAQYLLFGTQSDCLLILSDCPTVWLSGRLDNPRSSSWIQTGCPTGWLSLISCICGPLKACSSVLLSLHLVHRPSIYPSVRPSWVCFAPLALEAPKG